MEYKKPYFDLCISDKCVANQPFINTAKKLLKYGYKTIAISTFLDGESPDSKKGNKKKKGKPRETDFVPHPVSIPDLTGCENLKILHRLTVIFSDSSTIEKVVKSVNFKKYDIFAVVPTNQKAFQFACSEVDADIISFDPEVRCAIKLSRKLYNLALERNVYFELMYAHAIDDSTLRKNIINVSHLYHTYGNSKNVIMTSWATNSMMIRGPYDLRNLGLLFGLTEEQSKNAISRTCQNLILRAENRKFGKSHLLVKTIEEVETMVIDDSEESDMEQDVTVKSAFKRSKPDN